MPRTGQNPTSGVLSLARRKELYNVCSSFDVVIIEDDPYWNLYYPSSHAISKKYREGTGAAAPSPSTNDNAKPVSMSSGHKFINELIPSLLSIDEDGRVIRLDSFSKTIAPGCRLGWVTAQPAVTEQIFRITDGTTQQPSGFIQAIVTKLLGDFSSSAEPGGWGLQGWIQWLEGLRDAYQRRMIMMAVIFEENRILTSGTEMFTFSWPMGGMFLWVRVNIEGHSLATSLDPKRLMLALWILCTQPPYRILTVPGGDFAANNAIKQSHGYRYLRFCFAAVEESTLEDKSRSFVQACRDFWDVEDSKDIDHILREEHSMNDDADADREVVDDW
jgi:DNA-binding transcriptional MocR family regulator